MGFLELSGADRLVVTATRTGAILLDTRDENKVSAAVAFAQRHHDGWREFWPGPLAPEIVLDFYKDKHGVGTFGAAETYLTLSGWSRPTDAREIEALLKVLDVPW
ncbi:hypothetical protein LuPra_02771 [Luteitalea pratensis]|uniref:Uncharacterized protein n=1 Tax=Luteitalea pratensis TaxID=1855912 RepID=A0A143PLS8_LUTPR|nr:hypothetical protein [Luteitalea pratensis]AMY09552.1 hypothetical protein LuPra_02771 [Luteitalea pratensis]